MGNCCTHTAKQRSARRKSSASHPERRGEGQESSLGWHSDSKASVRSLATAAATPPPPAAVPQRLEEADDSAPETLSPLPDRDASTATGLGPSEGSSSGYYDDTCASSSFDDELMQKVLNIRTPADVFDNNSDLFSDGDDNLMSECPRNYGKTVGCFKAPPPFVLSPDAFAEVRYAESVGETDESESVYSCGTTAGWWDPPVQKRFAATTGRIEGLY